MQKRGYIILTDKFREDKEMFWKEVKEDAEGSIYAEPFENVDGSIYV